MVVAIALAVAFLGCWGFSVKGVVQDQSGSPVANARVVFVGDGGDEGLVYSGASGEFSFACASHNSEYEVHVENHLGFEFSESAVVACGGEVVLVERSYADVPMVSVRGLASRLPAGVTVDVGGFFRGVFDPIERFDQVVITRPSGFVVRLPEGPEYFVRVAAPGYLTEYYGPFSQRGKYRARVELTRAGFGVAVLLGVTDDVGCVTAHRLGSSRSGEVWLRDRKAIPASEAGSLRLSTGRWLLLGADGALVVSAATCEVRAGQVTGAQLTPVTGQCAQLLVRVRCKGSGGAIGGLPVRVTSWLDGCSPGDPAIGRHRNITNANGVASFSLPVGQFAVQLERAGDFVEVYGAFHGDRAESVNVWVACDE